MLFLISIFITGTVFAFDNHQLINSEKKSLQTYVSPFQERLWVEIEKTAKGIFDVNLINNGEERCYGIIAAPNIFGCTFLSDKQHLIVYYMSLDKQKIMIKRFSITGVSEEYQALSSEIFAIGEGSNFTVSSDFLTCAINSSNKVSVYDLQQICDMPSNAVPIEPYQTYEAPEEISSMKFAGNNFLTFTFKDRPGITLEMSK